MYVQIPTVRCAPILPSWQPTLPSNAAAVRTLAPSDALSAALGGWPLSEALRFFADWVFVFCAVVESQRKRGWRDSGGARAAPASEPSSASESDGEENKADAKEKGPPAANEEAAEDFLASIPLPSEPPPEEEGAAARFACSSCPCLHGQSGGEEESDEFRLGFVCVCVLLSSGPLPQQPDSRRLLHVLLLALRWECVSFVKRRLRLTREAKPTSGLVEAVWVKPRSERVAAFLIRREAIRLCR